MQLQQLIDQLKADDLQRLDPPELELRLIELIGLYTRHCTLELAESVARHFEALYLHPTISACTDRQCALRRFAAHWRWIAARHRNSSAEARVRSLAGAPGHSSRRSDADGCRCRKRRPRPPSWMAGAPKKASTVTI